jgi:hypothetical protein
MLFSSWLRNRKRAAPLAARPSPLAPHRRASFRPRLEMLEDRTLLSTYVVNSLTDTGTGSGLAGDLPPDASAGRATTPRSTPVSSAA